MSFSSLCHIAISALSSRGGIVLPWALTGGSSGTLDGLGGLEIAVSCILQHISNRVGFDGSTPPMVIDDCFHQLIK